MSESPLRREGALVDLSARNAIFYLNALIKEQYQVDYSFSNVLIAKMYEYLIENIAISNFKNPFAYLQRY